MDKIEQLSQLINAIVLSSGADEEDYSHHALLVEFLSDLTLIVARVEKLEQNILLLADHLRASYEGGSH